MIQKLINFVMRRPDSQGGVDHYPFAYVQASNGLVIVRHDGNGNFWWHPGASVRFTNGWMVTITMDPRYKLDSGISLVDERLFRSAARRFPDSEFNF